MDSAQLTREDSIRSVAHEACANNLDAAKLYADQGLLPGFDFDGEVDLAYSAAQGYVGQLGVCEDRVEGALANPSSYDGPMEKWSSRYDAAAGTADRLAECVDENLICSGGRDPATGDCLKCYEGNSTGDLGPFQEVQGRCPIPHCPSYNHSPLTDHWGSWALSSAGAPRGGEVMTRPSQ